jgi:hypothetical protein
VKKENRNMHAQTASRKCISRWSFRLLRFISRNESVNIRMDAMVVENNRRVAMSFSQEKFGQKYSAARPS